MPAGGQGVLPGAPRCRTRACCRDTPEQRSITTALSGWSSGRVVLLSQGALQPYHRDNDRLWANTHTCRTIAYLRGLHGNMGTVVRPHPALGEYPHDGWCHLNLVHLISNAFPMDLEPFGSGHIDPIIRSMDNPDTMADT